MTTDMQLNAAATADVLAALSLSQVPDVHWLLGDDLCDCTFQRIGDWTNPYLGQTLRVRLCCIWAELYKQYPQFVQQIPAYYDENTNTYHTEPMAWNSEETAMPVYLWLRHMAVKDGISVSEAREKYGKRDGERPGPVPKGTGWQSFMQPSEDTVRAAHEARLKASGWLPK